MKFNEEESHEAIKLKIIDFGQSEYYVKKTIFQSGMLSLLSSTLIDTWGNYKRLFQ